MADQILNSIEKITATDIPGVYVVLGNMTDFDGAAYDFSYGSFPEDTAPFNLVIRQWMIDNDGSFTIAPYVPPTTEELRASMPDLTARQLRLGLIGNGIMPSQVDTALNAMPAGAAKEMALVEWDYASSFRRLHPLIASVGAALSLTDAQIDAMWTAAASL